MATFSVVPDDISATANGMNFTTTTRPSTAQVETWIEMAAGSASTAIGGAGADPETVELSLSSDGLRVVQSYVISEVASLAISARDRDATTLVELHARRSRDIFRRIQTDPTALGTQRNTTTSAPGLTWAPEMDSTDRRPTRDAAFFANTSGRI